MVNKLKFILSNDISLKSNFCKNSPDQTIFFDPVWGFFSKINCSNKPKGSFILSLVISILSNSSFMNFLK